MAYRKKTKKGTASFDFFGGTEGTMGRGEEMRTLCEDIVNSFDARVGRVKELRDGTAAMLKGFRHDLRQKASDLKRFLSNAEASRMRDFRAMHRGIRARQAERNAETTELMNSFHRGSEQRAQEVGNMLGGFRREQKAMASHWRNMAATMARRHGSAA